MLVLPVMLHDWQLARGVQLQASPSSVFVPVHTNFVCGVVLVPCVVVATVVGVIVGMVVDVVDDVGVEGAEEL